MPTSDDTKTMISGVRNTSGEDWKNEDSTGEWTAAEDRGGEEFREDWETEHEDGEEAEPVEPVFAEFVDELEPDATDDDLDLFEDDDAGLEESDDWDDFSEDEDLDEFGDMDEI